MIELIVGRDIEASLLLFKKMVKKEGILKQLEDKEFAMSRREKRKRKDLEALRRKKQSERRRFYSAQRAIEYKKRKELGER